MSGQGGVYSVFIAAIECWVQIAAQHRFAPRESYHCHIIVPELIDQAQFFLQRQLPAIGFVNGTLIAVSAVQIASVGKIPHYEQRVQPSLGHGKTQLGYTASGGDYAPYGRAMTT